MSATLASLTALLKEAAARTEAVMAGRPQASLPAGPQAPLCTPWWRPPGLVFKRLESLLRLHDAVLLDPLAPAAAQGAAASVCRQAGTQRNKPNTTQDGFPLLKLLGVCHGLSHGAVKILGAIGGFLLLVGVAHGVVLLCARRQAQSREQQVEGSAAPELCLVCRWRLLGKGEAWGGACWGSATSPGIGRATCSEGWAAGALAWRLWGGGNEDAGKPWRAGGVR
eukprot:CAMPEP_0117651040 /NCGR_PEP_ID=MMETSP0804-20121206/1876_1 /TAXON_ID=1074897 /ORGANISM="Tetraselmis astigmatica, Strain CCMP880" /LENGTH=223 /DNA_ID=CAMNT_0005456983 /DNA_START=32 /DNA_END=703 /DNA_ORIENTATION=-